MKSRYVIGIDLGTSNCALAYIDTLADALSGGASQGGTFDHTAQTLPIEQLQAPSVVVERSMLPSFCYLPPNASAGASTSSLESSLTCPFYSNSPQTVVGEMARGMLASTPSRVVASAKSWLCHSGVDRTAKILPWNSLDVDADQKISPVAAAAEYLTHLKDLWNYRLGRYHQDYRFEQQDITITVPASFAEDALELTLAAARLAGYPEHVRLLEEPQAALYAFLGTDRAKELLEELHHAGKRSVLVCDVGGGTSDFSLFELTGPSSVKRIAVSDHLLLGGDNIDLLLAYQAEQRLLATSGATLSPRQWNYLVHTCRTIKEQIFSTEDLAATATHEIAIPGEGSNLFSSTLRATLASNEVIETVLEGFFPLVNAESVAEPTALLQEWGLPYEKDPAVTRHLLRFLEARPVDAVLFNGGSVVPPLIRRRICQAIAGGQQERFPEELPATDLSLCVAHGAARYGLALRTKQGLITGGYARSLYVQVETGSDDPEHHERSKLVCIVPHGFEVNQRANLASLTFELLLGTPVSFQLFSSRHRASDQLGSVTTLADLDFHPLPPLTTVLDRPPELKVSKQTTARVRLEVSFDEVGLLRLACVQADGTQAVPHRWQLSFNVRSDEPLGSESLVPALDQQALKLAAQRIGDYFGKAGGAAKANSPKYLVQELEQIVHTPREAWDLASLRSLWPALQVGITRRGRSAAHEASWLYLAGYVLRPGYGTDLDPHFVNELWRVFELGLSFPKENHVLNQSWIMWRRVAGGLREASQEKLFEKSLALYRQRGDEPELLRMLCSLERVSPSQKCRLGEQLIERITGKRKGSLAHLIWSLGRIGSRVPLYGSAHQVIPPATIAEWYQQLAPLEWQNPEFRPLLAAVTQMCRRTGDRTRDLTDEQLRLVLAKLQTSGGSVEQVQMVREVVAVTSADTVQLFGEQLPAGLRLAS